MEQKPLIGVYSTGKALARILVDGPREKAGALVRAARELGQTVYFFSLNDVDTDRQLIKGTYLDEEERVWKQGLFPYPRVFYKRSGSFTATDKFLKFLAQLDAKGSVYLNHPHSFNKCKVFEKLAKVSSVKDYLPETKLLKDKKVLLGMLRKHKEVYIKACLGSRGRRVARIKDFGADRYQWSQFRDHTSVKIIRGLDELYEEIRCFVLDRDCLVQAAINLIRHNNRLMDFRAEVQRSPGGEILTYAIPIRVGAVSSPITTHSESFPFEEFLAKELGYTPNEIIALKIQVQKFLTAIYSALEQVYGPLGEVGIDFGLDKSGHLWFIECNSQSAKVSLFNSYEQEVINQHFKTLVEYALSVGEDAE